MTVTEPCSEAIRESLEICQSGRSYGGKWRADESNPCRFGSPVAWLDSAPSGDREARDSPRFVLVLVDFPPSPRQPPDLLSCKKGTTLRGVISVT
jgi:hypothetical protein